MLAPCMTVLSTSKNAADVGSSGWLSAASTSAAAAAASPASAERCWRFSTRGRSGGGTSFRLAIKGPGHAGSKSALWKYPAMAPPATLPAGPATDVADLLTQAAEESPERLAVVEAGGRRMSWRELDDEVGRLATGLGAAGVVAGHRVMIAMGNRIEFVSS